MNLPAEGQSELLRICTAELVLLKKQLQQAEAEIKILQVQSEVIEVVTKSEVCGISLQSPTTQINITFTARPCRIGFSD